MPDHLLKEALKFLEKFSPYTFGILITYLIFQACIVVYYALRLKEGKKHIERLAEENKAYREIFLQYLANAETEKKANSNKNKAGREKK